MQHIQILSDLRHGSIGVNVARLTGDVSISRRWLLTFYTAYSRIDNNMPFAILNGEQSCPAVAGWLSRYSSERKHSSRGVYPHTLGRMFLNRITRADRAESISPVRYANSRVRRVWWRNGQKKTPFISLALTCMLNMEKKWKGKKSCVTPPGNFIHKTACELSSSFAAAAHAPFILFTQKSPLRPLFRGCWILFFWRSLSFRLFCHSGATWSGPLRSSCLLRV